MKLKGKGRSMQELIGYGVLAFMTLIGGILGSKYLNDSRERHRMQLKSDVEQLETAHQHEMEKLEAKLEGDLEKAEQRAANWKHQAKLAREGVYELGPIDDDDYIDPNAPREAQLGDLAQSIFPQIPDALKPILNQPETYQLLVKLANRNPELADGLLKKFYRPGAKVPRQAPSLPAGQGAQGAGSWV